ncbi:MAG: DUF4177 domain-containing protein [Pseudomonadota bacterium]
MTQFEYKVVAAPRRAKRVRGVKAPQDRFATTIADTINEAAADGWEFYRSETLPVDERQGMLKGRVEVLQSLLVFRRLTKAGRDAAGSPTQPDRATAPDQTVAEPAAEPARGPVLRPPPSLGDDEAVPVIRMGKPVSQTAD